MTEKTETATRKPVERSEPIREVAGEVITGSGVREGSKILPEVNVQPGDNVPQAVLNTGKSVGKGTSAAPAAPNRQHSNASTWWCVVSTQPDEGDDAGQDDGRPR